MRAEVDVDLRWEVFALFSNDVLADLRQDRSVRSATKRNIYVKQSEGRQKSDQ